MMSVMLRLWARRHRWTSEYPIKWREYPQSEGMDAGVKAPLFSSLFRARRERIFHIYSSTSTTNFWRTVTQTSLCLSSMGRLTYIFTCSNLTLSHLPLTAKSRQLCALSFITLLTSTSRYDPPPRILCSVLKSVRTSLRYLSLVITAAEVSTHLVPSSILY